MVVKLIRIDDDNSTSLEIKENKIIFGRADIQFCKDKNISRTHVQLKILQNAVRVKALNLNPCFYWKKGMDGFKLLKKGNTVDLRNGEVFGLLALKYWFEVKFQKEENNQAEVSVYTNEPVANVKSQQKQCDSREQNEQTCTTEEGRHTDTTTQQECVKKGKLSQSEESTDSGIAYKVKLTGDEAIPSTSGVNFTDENNSTDQTLPAPSLYNAHALVDPPQQRDRESYIYGTNCFRFQTPQYSHIGVQDPVFNTFVDLNASNSHILIDEAIDFEEQANWITPTETEQGHYVNINIWIKSNTFEGERALSVEPHMTIRDLAIQCEHEFRIPVARQHWTVGLMHYSYDTTLVEAAGPGLTSQFSLYVEDAKDEPNPRPQPKQQQWTCNMCGNKFGPRAGIVNIDCYHVLCLKCITSAVKCAANPPILLVRSRCFVCDQWL